MTRDQILALEQRRFKAMCAGDVGALDELLHRDLKYTHSSGVVDSKASYLRALLFANGKFNRLKIYVIKYFRPKLRVVNGTSELARPFVTRCSEAHCGFRVNLIAVLYSSRALNSFLNVADFSVVVFSFDACH